MNNATRSRFRTFRCAPLVGWRQSGSARTAEAESGPLTHEKAGSIPIATVVGESVMRVGDHTTVEDVDGPQHPPHPRRTRRSLDGIVSVRDLPGVYSAVAEPGFRTGSTSTCCVET